MQSNRMALLTEPEKLRGALAPLRRRLLSRLRTPASATELARELEISRQKINYHLRRLEEAGLIELVEERQRRGCVERIMRARADAYVIDPSLMSVGPSIDSNQGPRERAGEGDRHAAEHLVAVASDTVREVTRMQAAAGQAGLRLLTFTLETEVRLGAPADLHRFTESLAHAIASVVSDFDSPGGRAYRVVGAGHPTPKPSSFATLASETDTAAQGASK
jgi:DNA-binding transcriptional ArsR family regulator